MTPARRTIWASAARGCAERTHTSVSKPLLGSAAAMVRSELPRDQLADVRVRRAQGREPRFTVAHVGRDEDGGAARRPGDGDVVDRAVPAGAGLVADDPALGKA